MSERARQSVKVGAGCRLPIDLRSQQPVRCYAQDLPSVGSLFRVDCFRITADRVSPFNQLFMKSMSPPASLTGQHLYTYQEIFRHPISHSLTWHAVRALLAQIALVTEEPNGNSKVTRNGQSLVLHPMRTKEIAETTELMELRHFLERSEPPVAADSEKEIHCLVVIDHHEARIFRSETHGSVPQYLMPHEPSDFFRHAHNSNDFSRGQEKPDPISYFGPLAKELKNAGKILVFGNGKGTSSEMEQFLGWLKAHHPELAARVIGSLVVDEHHLTEAQILAKAREFHVVPASWKTSHR